MWILFLNDMRSPKCEILEPVARAETKEELQRFLERESVEPWTDDGTHQFIHHSDDVFRAAGGIVIDPPRQHSWRKFYRQGGPLEWYNQPYSFEEHRHFINVGTLEGRLEEMRERTEAAWQDMLELPPVN